VSNKNIENFSRFYDFEQINEDAMDNNYELTETNPMPRNDPRLLLLVARERMLSFAARGMLLYIYTQPLNWIIDIDDLCQGCNREQAILLLEELRTAGYVRYRTSTN
jgi:hypothetical protein